MSTVKAEEKKAAPSKGAKKGSSKAEKVVKAVTQTPKVHKKKIRTSIRFRVKKSPIVKKNPRVPARSVIKQDKMNEYRVVRTPLTTEAALKKVANSNTLVFLCDRKATKPMIKQAIAKRFDVKVIKCNTLIRPDGQKKAFVRLHADYDALDVANKIGIL
eukprot:Protomagalhaensia_sp_Gyna_25__837@NODE_1402_length_1868_cov_624_011482_g1130_i0_p2_GENE_NODE_1402_length_1868_cov_624_011482_g1130_i0NODE_1402_length_1868_cov_624_011482_g1130_i0_p2_ORF_typecomplete_len159_score48_02Ribosomal_L23/PF00276_20/3_5e03Ribosomal_L23/PF00276_20/6_8e18Ribosomal_L23eN/PF03939_13/4_7e05Ribosomal_L23eN/PF03939_13/5_2e03YihI/PF04220_12/0_036_NODE_1402_length_1868_cov_624_011482_g1130_i013141790